MKLCVLFNFFNEVRTTVIGRFSNLLLSIKRKSFPAAFGRLLTLLIFFKRDGATGISPTQKARVALGYRLGQLFRFFRALQTSHVVHNSIVHAKA